MTEVPELMPDELKQRVVGWWIGNYYGSIGYIGKRLGKKGVREFRDLGARQVAATFKHIGITRPEEVVLAVATNEKNMFGSEIEVEEGDGYAVIRRERCALLEGAKAFARLGASLVAREHCKSCEQAHWTRVFAELGMKVETEHTEGGCVMKVSMK